jgi:hypothetical protein
VRSPARLAGLAGRTVTAVAFAVVLGTLLPAAAAAHPSTLQFGYGDPLFESKDAATREVWLQRAAAAGGSIARINVYWSAVAPAHPGDGFVGSDPASPAYRWRDLDASVRSAAAAGLPVMFTVFNAPAWAEGKEKPGGAADGTWRPQRPLFAAFGKALARRYDGAYPDPLAPGRSLPRVPFYEVWNEPNQEYYLAPQWDAGRLVGPGIYRNLVNAFYGAVKGVDPSATVIAGSMSPYGDPPGGSRTPPVVFLRTMLCLRGERLRPSHCRNPAHLDILSDHPITFGAPRESARSPLDVSTPNLPRLTRILRRAQQTHRVLPAGRKPLWATEFWYDSNPPDPHGLPLARQARWYEEAAYEVWKGGASAFFLQPLRDTAPVPDFDNTLQSGLYFLNGTAKPSRQAMRFPLVAERLGQRRVRVWGIAPRPGRVEVQALRGGKWRAVATVQAGGTGHPFTATIALAHRASLRARIGSEVSLAWRQG